MKLKTIGISTIALLVVFTLSSCATKKIKVDAIPKIVYLQERPVPADEPLDTTIIIEAQKTDKVELMDNITSRRNLRIAYDSKVVISVPVEEQKRESKQKNQQNGTLAGEISFKTTGYFHLAEQQIEKRLIEKYFAVLDRSKFEAKLRNLRSEQDIYHFKRLSTDGLDAARNALIEAYKSRSISFDEYVKKLAEMDEQKNIDRSSRRKAGQEQELVDISELIRAAQTGDTRADYIFQVNEFRIGFLTEEKLNLLDNDEIIALGRKHKGLMEALEIKGREAYEITRPGLYSMLNAKLIKVDTGAIVWVGEHQVRSEHIMKKGFKIKIQMLKSVTNGQAVGQAVDKYNADLRRLEKSVITAGKAVNKKGIKKEQQKKAKIAYDVKLAELKRQLKNGPPAAAVAQWQYQYDINRPRTFPKLPTADELQQLAIDARIAEQQVNKTEMLRLTKEQRRNNQILNSHRNSLAKLVTKELIGTIPTSDNMTISAGPR